MANTTLKNVTLRSNARVEELRIYFLLSNTLFNNKKVIIGDNVNNKEPDVFAKDYSVGLEVVSCDLLKHFKQSANLQGSINESKKDRNKTKSMLKQFVKLKPADPKQIKADEEEFYARLEQVLTNKHERLNDGSYNACKERNLAILSDYGQKTFVNLNTVHKIYSNITSKFKENFNNVFISLNEQLYNVTTKEKVQSEKPNVTTSTNQNIEHTK